MGISTISNGRPAGSRILPQALQIVLKDLVVLVLRIFFDRRHDRCGADESGQVVDVAVGVVAGNSFAEPEDLGLAVIVLQVLLDLGFAERVGCGFC